MICIQLQPSTYEASIALFLTCWQNIFVDEQVLQCIEPINDEDVVIGQYEGYKDDPTVPKDSFTPTFASIVLRINNERWDGT